MAPLQCYSSRGSDCRRHIPSRTDGMSWHYERVGDPISLGTGTSGRLCRPVYKGPFSTEGHPLLLGTSCWRIFIMPITLVDYAVLGLALLLFRWAHDWQSKSRHHNVPHPPGPPGLPLIGNLKDIPKHPAWLTYRGWSREYGKCLARHSVMYILMYTKLQPRL